MRSIILIYLLVFSNSTLLTLLAKQAQLTAKHDDLLAKLAIINDENKNYSSSKSPLHQLLGRLSDIKEASRLHSTYRFELNDRISSLKQTEAQYFYAIKDSKMSRKYSAAEQISLNLIEENPQLAALLQDFDKSNQSNSNAQNALYRVNLNYKDQVRDLTNQTSSLFMKEIRYSEELMDARIRIARLSGSDILTSQILLEDAYDSEIDAISRINSVFQQIKENRRQENEDRLKYETESLLKEYDEDFCFNSFLELAKYFGYSYSAIYIEETIKYFDSFRKIVRMVIDAEEKFSLGQNDANLKRNMHNLNLYFEKITKEYFEKMPVPISFLNRDRDFEFRLPKTVTFKDEDKIKNIIYELISESIWGLQNSFFYHFTYEKLSYTFASFLKVIDQSEKIDKIWNQIDDIKVKIKELNVQEQRMMYMNEDNLEKFRKLKLETKQIQEELEKVNEEISFMI